MRKANVVVVGATGAVGQVFLRILEERRFPVDRLRLCASPRSVGKRLKVNGEEVVVEATIPQIFEGADFAFISASSAVSRELAPIAARAGAMVIDDSSVFRMDPDVPLVVPEVNADDLQHHRGIASIPNCTTTPVVMALYPLHRVNPVRRIVADSYQAVSGTGAAAMRELREQTSALLNGGQAVPSVYPHQIAFNVIPQVERFLEDGYTTEERKMRDETRKIMHAPDIAISATCVRVPVHVSHSIALHVEFERPMGPDEARELMGAFPGVTVVDDPKTNRYPMPWQAEGKDEVFVGRVRKDASHPNGLAMWVVSDNLRKGAALDAIQIAEEVLKRDLLSRGRKGQAVAPVGTSHAPMSHAATDPAKDTFEKGHEKDGNAVFESDVEWFHQHGQELVRQYQDQYVAILNGAVVDHDPAFEKLAERVYAKYGYRDFVMQKVRPNAKPYRIVSPRLVRP